MKVTEQTTLGELAAILRSLPFGTRLHLGANKPGDYTAIIRSFTLPAYEFIAHKNSISEAIDEALQKIIVASICGDDYV